jgi:hypothetical protein
MRRHTERTEQQVAVQRYTHLLTLPDRELCQQWHRAKPLPADHGGCTYWLITPDSSTTPCRRGGERWAIQIPGLGVRRRCTPHTADAIRAQIYLFRRRIQRGMTP